MRRVFDGFHELLNEQTSAERLVLGRNIRRLVVAAITAAALLISLNIFQLALSLVGFKHHWSQDIEGLNAWGLPQLALISALLGPIITMMWCVSACHFNCCCAALAHLIVRMSERLTTLGEGSALSSLANQKEERKVIAESVMREFGYYSRVIRLVKVVDKTFEIYAFLMLALNIPASVMILVKSFIGLHSSWVDFVVNVAELAYNFAGLLALTVLPARVHSLLSDVEENIHNNRHIWVPYDEEVYQVANVFVVQTRRPGLGLSLWGFTIVSKSLILKIMRLTLLFVVSAASSLVRAWPHRDHTHVIFGKTLSHDEHLDWHAYQSRSDRVESLASDEERMEAFLRNHEFVRLHNAKYARGEVTYEVGLTGRSYWPEWEIKHLHGHRVSAESLSKSAFSESRPFPVNVEVPESVDWREKGAVTRVKNQLGCGTCWAFSATGALEAAHFIKTGHLVELSEQNLYDCATETAGYDNGNSLRAEEPTKPFATSKITESTPRRLATTAVGHFRLPEGDEERLKAAVATVGPVSVAINSQHDGWKHYVGDGVYYEADCPNTEEDLTHEVLVVGYGTQEDGGDYWIVKNSWGEDTYGNK
ncbi:cathepsin-L-like cysteine peptidase 02 [Aphelenchoides avenae]|nr:cathepsin-L-like cysteine peptidase 02 [Aphelenchus avenae]